MEVLLAIGGEAVPSASDVADPLAEPHRFCVQVFDMALRYVEVSLACAECLGCCESAVEVAIAGGESVGFRLRCWRALGQAQVGEEFLLFGVCRVSVSLGVETLPQA